MRLSTPWTTARRKLRWRPLNRAMLVMPTARARAGLSSRKWQPCWAEILGLGASARMEGCSHESTGLLRLESIAMVKRTCRNEV